MAFRDRIPFPRPRRATGYLGALLAVLALASVGCSLPHRKPVTPTDAAHTGTLSGGYGLPVGQPFPDARVSDVTGKETTLAGVFAQRPVVLVFYRGGWCPYCNFQLHELATKGEELRKRGVVVVAISVDKPQYGAKTAQEHAAAFEVLSDPDLVAHKAFRVVNHIGGPTAFALARMGEDLETRSGRDHHDVAVPAIFLIDRAGIIRWAHTDPDYKRRPSATAVLEAIDGSGLAKGSAETPKQLPAPTGP